VVILVDIALGTLQPSACPFGLAYPGGAVTVDQLIVAVNNALHGCSFQVFEPHLGVQVPGAFTLDQPDAYPNTIIVFLQAPPPRCSAGRDRQLHCHARPEHL
jgi:hypothetical protein